MKTDLKEIKAFLFDMDGVLINSENVWKKYEVDFFAGFLSPKTYDIIKDNLIGTSLKEIFRIINQNGENITWEKFAAVYDENAKKVYQEAELTNGLEDLLTILKKQNKKIALVSASRQNWINQVLTKFTKNYFQEVISVVDSKNLRDKPNPDGYLEAMKKLKVSANEVAIVEDSNTGLTSAKAANPRIIFAMQEHLVHGYDQIDVGIKINNLQELRDYFEI